MMIQRGGGLTKPITSHDAPNPSSPPKSFKPEAPAPVAAPEPERRSVRPRNSSAPPCMAIGALPRVRKSRIGKSRIGISRVGEARVGKARIAKTRVGEPCIRKAWVARGERAGGSTGIDDRVTGKRARMLPRDVPAGIAIVHGPDVTPDLRFQDHD